MKRSQTQDLDPSLTGRLIRASVVLYAGFVLLVIPAAFGGAIDSLRRYRKRKYKNVRKRPEHR